MSSVKVTPTVSGSTCPPQPAALDPVAFQTSAALCSGAFAACTQGFCGPQNACVAASGQHECPSPFNHRTLYFGAVDDQRECTCACVKTSGTCDFAVEDSCSGGTAITTTGCNPSTSNSYELTSLTYVPPASCVPTEGSGAVEGEVVGTAPITVCCTVPPAP